MISVYPLIWTLFIKYYEYFVEILHQNYYKYFLIHTFIPESNLFKRTCVLICSFYKVNFKDKD